MCILGGLFWLRCEEWNDAPWQQFQGSGSFYPPWRQAQLCVCSGRLCVFCTIPSEQILNLPDPYSYQNVLSCFNLPKGHCRCLFFLFKLQIFTISFYIPAGHWDHCLDQTFFLIIGKCWLPFFSSCLYSLFFSEPAERLF